MAILPPLGYRAAVGSMAALGAGTVGLTGLAVGEAFPPMRVFATTFVGLIGAVAVVMVARSRPLPRPTSGPVVTAVGITGVASCIAATVYLVDRYPAAALHHPAAAILLATILAGALRLVVAPPRTLTGDRLARLIAVGVALVLGLGLLQTSRSDLGGSGDGIFGYVFSVPVVAIFVTAAAVAALRRSIWAGVQATVWTALLASMAFFAIAVAEAVLWWFLVLFPFFWTPFGVIGAAIGRAGRARLSRAR